MPPKCLMIVNPISGLGSARRQAPKLAAALRAHGWEVELFETTGPGDARRAAEEAKPDATSAILCAGGDGTVNEIINGLGDKRIPVALLPAGTGNVLAKEYGIPSRVERVADLIARGRTRMLDVGVLGERRFILFAGVGFDAEVALAIHRRRSGRICMLHYVWPILKTLCTYRFPTMNVAVDGRDEGAATTVLVSNVHSYGGPFGFLKDADPTDGLFDICLLRGRTRRALVRYIWGGFRRRILAYKDVTHVRGATIELRSEAAVPIQVDGDFVGTVPARIELLRARVPVIVP